MGQLVIEAPENINCVFQVDDSEFSKKLLENLEDFEKKAGSDKLSSIIPPRRHNLKEDLAAVVGIWADREESAEEIARKRHWTIFRCCQLLQKFHNALSN